jgi:hypothetical protein
MQPLLCAPRLGDDGRRLIGGMTSQSVAERRTMTIMPGGLHEDPASMGVAGLGESAASVPIPRRVLAGHQPQIGHERPRTAKTLEVDDLGHQDHGRQRIDAAETPQGSDGLAVARVVREVFDRPIEIGPAAQRLLEGLDHHIDSRGNERFPPVQGSLRYLRSYNEARDLRTLKQATGRVTDGDSPQCS